jgi:hypothetical protein
VSKIENLPEQRYDFQWEVCMETNQQQSTRFQVITHDCGLIMEAIRRLIDGTWRLNDEDQSYSWELFPKIRDSLIEHIRFEEAVLFPRLSLPEQARHRTDHRRLQAHLWSVERALTEMKAEYFHDLLDELQLMLHEHHKEFAPVLMEGDACCSSCNAEEKILARAQNINL